MKYRRLGNSGLQVSMVGLGCNNFGVRLDLEGSKKVVHKALDAGITLFDTADIYGDQLSETYLGEALGARRKDVVIATKVGEGSGSDGRKNGASRRHIMRTLEQSLKKLKTDWIDLYQIHVPDPGTPIDETLRALDDLVRQGKVRYLGCSKFAAWQMVEAEWAARTQGLERFVSCQSEYSLLVRRAEKELLPAIDAYRLGFLPFFPLAAGLLTGKYRRGLPPPDGARLANTPAMANRFLANANWPLIEGLEVYCAERGKTLLQLAFSWLAAHPAVSSVIAGASRREQVEQNVAAVDWALTAEDMAAIDKL